MAFQLYSENNFGDVPFQALAGEVAEEPEDFFSIKNIKPGYGLGTRFKLFRDKDIWLRFDIGSGINGNSGIYFGINEAF